MNYKDKTQEELVSVIQELQQEINSLKELYNTDISSYKNAEDALRENEEKYRLIFEYSPLGLLSFDEKGCIVACNDYFVKIIGSSREKLIGLNMLNLPDKNLVSSVQKAVNGTTGFYEDDYKSTTANKITPVRVLFAPMEIEKGKIRGGVGIIEDITERKKVEKALLDSESNNRLLLDLAPDAFFQGNEKGDIIMANKNAVNLTGYSHNELLEMNIKELFSTSILNKKPLRYDILDKGEIFLSEREISRKDGSLRVVEMNSRKMPNNTYQSFMKDITERKQAEQELISAKEKAEESEKNLLLKNEEYEALNEELNQTNEELLVAKEKAEESNRLKSAFLANMSHEIRTPMNGIIGFADLLKEPQLTGEEQQEYISIIEKSGKRMLNIINDIIDISKIESGEMKVLISETNINEQIEDVHNFFQPEVEKKGISLNIKSFLNANEANIKSDAEKIYAILTNLTKNAIKFTDKGTIEFGYVKKGSLLEFFVKDTGIGIPKNRQKEIFKRFVQADIADKRAYQGAGLGLSITKAFVEMLGGEIWLESEENKGSIFYFTIPYNAELGENNKIISTNSDEKPIDNLKKLKVLIVEDDEISDVYITLLLAKYNCEVLHANTGVKAVDACRNNPDLDLIMMDIKMPEMNGYETTQQIRKFNQKIVIFAQTAHVLAGDKEKSLAVGCNEYIPKPLSQFVLKELILKYFNK